MPRVHGVSYHVHLHPDRNGERVARVTVTANYRRDLVGQSAVMMTGSLAWDRGQGWGHSVAQALRELAEHVDGATAPPEVTY